MKPKLILLFILCSLLQYQCNQGKQQPIAQQEQKQIPVDSTGAKPYPVKITIVKEVDTVYGFALAKAVINEKTLQAEMQVIKYMDEKMDTFPKGTRITDIQKR